MKKDKEDLAADVGIDVLRDAQNINRLFSAVLPDIFSNPPKGCEVRDLNSGRLIAADIETFRDAGLTIGAHANYFEVSSPVALKQVGYSDHLDSTAPGELGAVIDRVNQKLQVLMSLLDGNTQGEKVVAEIADILRAHYRAEELESTGRYVAVGSTVKLYSEVVGRMRSNSMAKRSARALNKQSHKF